MPSPLEMLDHPRRLNEFLAIIGGAPVAAAPRRPLPQTDVLHNDHGAELGHPSSNSSLSVTKNGTQSNDNSGTGTPEVGSLAPSAASSPARGTRAPPSTPANLPVIPESALDLEPAGEDQDGSDVFRQLADASNLTLQDSVHAPKSSDRSPEMSSKTACHRRSFQNTFTPLAENSPNTRDSLSPSRTSRSTPSSFIDSILIKFHDTHTTEVMNESFTPAKAQNYTHGSSVTVKADETVPFPAFDEAGSLAKLIHHDFGPEATKLGVVKFASDKDTPHEVSFTTEEVHKTPFMKVDTNVEDNARFATSESSNSMAEAFFEPAKGTTANTSNTEGASKTTSPKSYGATADEPSTTLSTKVNTSTMVALHREESSDEDVKTAARAVTSALERSTLNKICEVDTKPGKKLEKPKVVVNSSTDKEQDDDQEHFIHFQSLGTPVAPDKLTSHVRKIVLSGLPASSDLTLVQGLVSGGAIETYDLSESKTTAYVTFTTAEACDNFYDKYPRGLSFKHSGRDYTVAVDKGQDVDVVSGMLQGYLDCGATRCVCATGPVEDWSMRALYKLAGSKSRKVEAIIDSHRSEVHTVVFRFTNIADAASIRGQLMRDEDWKACNIHFTDDPCEKATGIHQE